MKRILAQQSPNNCHGSNNQKKNDPQYKGIDYSTEEESKFHPSPIEGT
jgi:hypothetical protein